MDGGELQVERTTGKTKKLDFVLLFSLLSPPGVGGLPVADVLVCAWGGSICPMHLLWP